jgi:hypothetical protein
MRKQVQVFPLATLLLAAAFLLMTAGADADDCPSADEQKAARDAIYQSTLKDCISKAPDYYAKVECQNVARRAGEALAVTIAAKVARCQAAKLHRAAYEGEASASVARAGVFITDEWLAGASLADLDGAADRIRAEATRLKALGDADVGDADGVASLAAKSVEHFEAMAAMMPTIVEAEKKCRVTKKCMAAREDAARQRAEAERKRVAAQAAAQAEAKFVGDVALPLCKATINVQQAQADIAREKANPAGVVDLSELHDLGEKVQENQDWIRRLSPSYTATRQHAFRGWRSEPACVLGNSNGWDNATDNIVVAPDRQ